ncbi:MAG: hypothetical protein JXI32_02120 [Deltaproteobacteria bacterium]|nr:hypothetical protein [Deltaproteobacteria bacterium]
MKDVTKQIGKIPGRSVIYLVLCAVVLIIFYFAALYPYQRALNTIDAKTAQVAALIKKQRTLMPLYEEMVKRGEGKIRGTLPVPDIQPLPRGGIETVSPLFQRMADESGMQVVSIRPDVLTLTEGSDDMVVTLQLRGAFLDFRKFLVRVGGALPLKRVEEIEIRQENGGRQFSLTVRLAIG